MKCPKCDFEFEIDKPSNKKYKTNKDDLKEYPDCFNNFQDCPNKPIDINFIFNKCKMCPYYQYSDFKANKEVKIRTPIKSREEKALIKELQDTFKILTKEQQEEILKQIKK